MNMLKYIQENYEGVERRYIDEYEDEIVSSYRLLMVGHNACGFYSWVVLSSSVKGITVLKNLKAAQGHFIYRSGVELK